MARVIDQYIIGQRSCIDRLSLSIVKAQVASTPCNFGFLAINFVFYGVAETWIAPFLIALIEVAKDFDQCLKEIQLAAAVLADKHVNKAASIKAQGKILEVFVLADDERFQAHADVLTLVPSRH